MNKFFSSVIGSFVGTWLAFMIFGVVIFISGIILIASMSFSGVRTPKTTISDRSVLYLDLSGEITERPYNKSLQEYIQSDNVATNDLASILSAIETAKYNSKIYGISLHCGAASRGYATSKAIRDALQDFKESGKWVYAYGESIEQQDYYVASVADSIFLNPVGMLDIHGLVSTIPFFKTALDKIGVEMQIIRVGTYKSAVEPYILTDMSDANRLQTQTFIQHIWDNLCDSISSARKIDKAVINEFADSLKTFKSPKVAVTEKFIDGLCYNHDFESKIKAQLGIDEDEEINYLNVADVSGNDANSSHSSHKIAVLYAAGDIVVSGDNKSICSDDIVPIILDLAKDDEIKGLVLRVNSPGGSAYASEQIWEALEQFKATGKPFAVSMGDYAASGGYYISCGAQRIFAEPTTITGSIGIFAMIPSSFDLVANKFVINFITVQTNANSDMSIFKPLTPIQRAAYQQTINQGYELFTSRCATGRKMELSQLKNIAEGRVWDATDAKKIGLIDDFGNINDAIDWVAQKAKIESDYSTVDYPKYEEDLMSVIYQTLSGSYYEAQMKERYGILFTYLNEINKVLNADKVQCRMELLSIK